MMKNFKLFLLSFVFIASFLTSCTNDEPLVEEQNIEDSESITTSLSQLRTQFNAQGDVIPSENPTGNIVFDFCFDFVYPLNLSYNNGTTVTVNSLTNLVDVMINSTEDLFINGIEFPFNVETYNDETGAIEIETINNENEFFDLLEDCDFNTVNSCECFEVYEPVCVEVEAPDGESFTITYPNECFAMCDGFTPNDFIEDCVDDYNNTGGFECFEFNFPISIITDDQQTITVNSQEELDNALYNSYYFDFVYPFNVTDDEGEVESIEDLEDFIELLEDCYDNGDDCPCPANVDPVCVEIEIPNGGTEIITFLNACEAECAGFYEGDYVDCENNNGCDCDDEEFDPVCVQYEVNGEVIIQVFPNACYAECEGFDESNFVDCNDIENPSGCSEEDISTLLVECQFWTVTIGDQEYTYVFGNDGTVNVSQNNDSIASGTWGTFTDASLGSGVEINTNSGNFNSTWLFYECDTPDGPEVISTANWIDNIESGCE